MKHSSKLPTVFKCMIDTLGLSDLESLYLNRKSIVHKSWIHRTVGIAQCFEYKQLLYKFLPVALCSLFPSTDLCSFSITVLPRSTGTFVPKNF